MKELPAPMAALFKAPAQSKVWGPRHTVAPLPTAAPAPSLSVSWARHLDEVRAAQRLRHEVFGVEMGARLSSPLPGHDMDMFDDYCEHLLVRDGLSGEVVGTYRLLTPSQAKRIGSYYCDLEFDLTRLRAWRGSMVELGRSCVHREHRNGAVIMALWGALARFMDGNDLRMMIGCATVPLGRDNSLGWHQAASLWRRLSEKHLAAIEYHVQPRLPLPVEQLDQSLEVEPPPLVKGYLRLGARLLGAPAWDPDFHAADLPMMMRLDELPARYRKHMLGS